MHARILVGLAVLAACERASEPPAPAQGAATVEVKRVKLEELGMPDHDPAKLADIDASARVLTQDGTMSATLNGQSMRFTTLPPGSNAAILNEAKGVARVLLGGAPTDDGMPMMRIVLEGLRLDQTKLPATITLGPPNQNPSTSRIVYEITPQKQWLSEPGATVTIESWAGKRLRGTFGGKLLPKSTAFGPPIVVTDGRFDIELRLNGAAPGPAPAG